MDSVIKYVNGFFGGLGTIMLAILPVTILWQVLTGTAVFGMDVIANLSALVQLGCPCDTENVLPGNPIVGPCSPNEQIVLN